MDYPDSDLPGTERLFDVREDGALDQSAITLIPQPTDSPNDPLRWSLFRKYWHTGLVCFITALTAATSNDAGSASDEETSELPISIDSLNIAAGVLFIGIGYTTLLLAPTVPLYGRRINYLICLLLGLGGAIFFACTQNQSDSIWNQLFVGASEACAEATVQTSLSDIFFQHQRGTVLGLYVLATNIGTYMGPLIAGYIADSSLGWRWIGWMSVIISGCTIILVYFGLEETTFDRRAYINGRSPPRSPLLRGQPQPEKKESPDQPQERHHSPEIVHVGEMDALPPSGKPYRKRIALITPAPNLKGVGFKQYFQRLWHILRVFGFPAVIYAGLQWGAQDAWLTFYLTLEEDNWYGPPWNYTDAAVAIMNVPCIIGSVIGCIYGGYLSDLFVSWMAKRNGGIAEAEHRLWLMFPAALISPAGLIMFGIGTNDGLAWHVPYLGLGFIGFGWGCAGDISMTYLMDAYPDMVMEGMVGVSVINNTFGCIFTFATGAWFDAQSVQNVMIAVGCLSFVFIMTSLPMMLYGKRARRWTLPRYRKFIELRDGIEGM